MILLLYYTVSILSLSILSIKFEYLRFLQEYFTVQVLLSFTVLEYFRVLEFLDKNFFESLHLHTHPLPQKYKKKEKLF